MSPFSKNIFQIFYYNRLQTKQNIDLPFLTIFSKLCSIFCCDCSGDKKTTGVFSKTIKQLLILCEKYIII